ncbi:MAG: hypothetical protein L0Z48_12145 [candidate division Zixibacteria bacterium]|nr:hypothetical protein [candidate division Zixibacteria bacterium]MCI0597276.1 hypothetical protein [candidate division Zixibacteria bacterium]
MNLLERLKAGFWKGLRFLGKLQAGLILLIFYLIGMGLLKLYIILTFKDPLGKRESKADSFWKPRSGVPEPESFKRQF